MKAMAMMVLAGVLAAASLAAQESSSYRTGTLVGFDARTQIVGGLGNSHYEEKTKNNGKKTIDGNSYTWTQTQVTYVLTVSVGEMTYTAEQPKSLLFGYNPTDMVVNDPVSVRIEKNKLIFLRPNGKEFKTTIVRMERNPESAARADIAATGVVASSNK